MPQLEPGSGNDRTIPFGVDVRELLEERQDGRTHEGDDFVMLGTEGGRLDPVYQSSYTEPVLHSCV